VKDEDGEEEVCAERKGEKKTAKEARKVERKGRQLHRAALEAENVVPRPQTAREGQETPARLEGDGEAVSSWKEGGESAGGVGGSSGAPDRPSSVQSSQQSEGKSEELRGCPRRPRTTLALLSLSLLLQTHLEPLPTH
jgi:hypothetical protein